MIKNERQYKITRVEIRRFESSLDELVTRPAESIHAVLRQAEIDALESQLKELRNQVSEYEALKQQAQVLLEVDSLGDFPRALIKARIASGFSQKDLALRLGLKEQQVQRYEATDYAAASLKRLTEVAEALNLHVSERVFVPAEDISISSFLGRLADNGIDEGFLHERVLPRQTAHDLRQFEGDETGLVLKVASAVSRAFKWTLPDILSVTRPTGPAVGFSGFKIPANADERRVHTYAFYAHTLALLVLRGAAGLSLERIPGDPLALRKEIIDAYAEVTFESTAAFLWDHGVAVLPLDDPGRFHGACWKIAGCAVVALNQTTQSQARWLFDLLHELHHLLKAGDSPEFSRVEACEISPARADTEDEINANNFAEDVMLAGKADDLAEVCVEKARNELRYLKRVVPEVSREFGVEVGALSNHLAFRLCSQGIDWWGAATNLQRGEVAPLDLARQLLFARLDLSELRDYDRELLMRSQTSEVLRNA